MDKLVPKIGVLFIATGRFRNMGEGTDRGTYELRKQQEAEKYLEGIAKIGEVVYSKNVYTREDLAEQMEQFAREKVDCVFALFLSWTEDFVWVRFLRDMYPVPILFAARTRDSICFGDTFAETDFVEYLCAGGLVGSLEASGSIARFDRPMMETTIGTYDQIMARLAVFAPAAAMRANLRKTNFALLASFNEVMWGTYMDPYMFFEKAGPELRFLSVATLAKEIEAVSDEQVKTAHDWLTERYEVLPDVDEKKFYESIRASIALENTARNAGVSTLVLNDVDTVLLTEVGLRPGFIPSPGSAADITIVPEGDMGGGLITYILKQLSGKPVNFIEPFHIDLPNNCFCGGHAGPNDYTDPRGKVKIARDVRFAKTSYKYAGAPFAWFIIPEGRRTMAHISQSAKGGLKLVCGLVDALPATHQITSYTHGSFRPVGIDIQEYFGRLINIGVTQHYGLVEGDYIAELRDFAKIMDMEFVYLNE